MSKKMKETLDEMLESMKDIDKQLDKLGKKIARESEPFRKLVVAWLIIHNPTIKLKRKKRGRPIKSLISPTLLMQNIKNRHGKPISRKTAMKLCEVLRYLKLIEERYKLLNDMVKMAKKR